MATATNQSYVTDGIDTIYFNLDNFGDNGQNRLIETPIKGDGVIIRTDYEMTTRKIQVTAHMIRGDTAPQTQYFDFVDMVRLCKQLTLHLEFEDTPREWIGAVAGWTTNMNAGESERVIFSFEFSVHTSSRDME